MADAEYSCMAEPAMQRISSMKMLRSSLSTPIRDKMYVNWSSSTLSFVQIEHTKGINVIFYVKYSNDFANYCNFLMNILWVNFKVYKMLK